MICLFSTSDSSKKSRGRPELWRFAAHLRQPQYALRKPSSNDLNMKPTIRKCDYSGHSRPDSTYHQHETTNANGICGAKRSCVGILLPQMPVCEGVQHVDSSYNIEVQGFRRLARRSRRRHRSPGERGVRVSASANGRACPAPAPMEQPAPQRPVALLNGEQLDECWRRLRCISDPLIAEVLPAATYPDELAAAAAWLQYNRNPTELAIDSQPWEPPIRALAHSPSVLIWMAENGDWTRALGTAFTYQGREVMDSIQRLRGEALAAGTLINTPQQVVVYQGSTLCIEPADPGVLYVPVYDWHEAYRRGYRPDAISFFVGSRIGGWLDLISDWDHRSVVEGARWDHGWDHRWDDDRNAHPVTIRDTVRIEGGNTPPPPNHARGAGGRHGMEAERRQAGAVLPRIDNPGQAGAARRAG